MTARVNNFVPEVRTFHVDDPRSLSVDLNDSYRDLSQGVNQRTIGAYATSPALTGNRIFGIASNTMMTYRVILQASSILNGTTSIAHGINTLDTMRLLSLTGGATSNPSSFLPLPYVNVGTPGNGIQLRINGANIEIITTTSDYTAYSALIVVEYALN